jgi:hypothetical protein
MQIFLLRFKRQLYYSSNFKRSNVLQNVMFVKECSAIRTLFWPGIDKFIRATNVRAGSSVDWRTIAGFWAAS